MNHYQDLDTGITKYQKYLTKHHDWESFNCFHLIESIYREFLGIELSDLFNRVKIDWSNSHITKRWFYQNFTKEKLREEEQNWVKVPLTDLQEFDILVFTTKKDRPVHFGLYITSNRFIHLEEYKNASFAYLDQDWRECLYGAYRHRSFK